MNISIGQYVPGESIFHRSDPRTKLTMTFAYMVIVLLINNFVGYAIAMFFLILAIVSSRVGIRMVLRSLRPIVFLIIFTVILNIFLYQGETLLLSIGFIDIYKEGILFSIQMILRILLLVAGASLLTYTTTSIMLTDGLEKIMSPLSVIGFPAHDIAMMISIALRFIPTFAEETERIMRAQASRGADFDSKKLREKIRSFIPVLVPLFIGAFRRATDLATAMEARCYRGGKNRTRYRVLQFSKADIVLTSFFIVFGVLVILSRIFF
jgi:energy-coupling factor transport system permease protein